MIRNLEISNRKSLKKVGVHPFCDQHVKRLQRQELGDVRIFWGKDAGQGELCSSIFFKVDLPRYYEVQS